MHQSTGPARGQSDGGEGFFWGACEMTATASAATLETTAHTAPQAFCAVACLKQAEKILGHKSSMQRPPRKRAPAAPRSATPLPLRRAWTAIDPPDAAVTRKQPHQSH